jgi:hypothetical protein
MYMANLRQWFSINHLFLVAGETTRVATLFDLYTKPSHLCGYANLLLGRVQGPNNRFAWSPSCECFVNNGPTTSELVRFGKPSVRLFHKNLQYFASVV